MKQLVKMQFGSIIYGTSLPSSDTDYKGVFLPEPRSIVLQRATKHIQDNTKKDNSTRNTSEDIDEESFSLSEYMKLLLEGQTMALDMLFTPQKFYLPLSDGDHSTHWWRTIQENRNRFLHKGTSSFVGYTKSQAAKYGLKGFRVSALRLVLDWISQKDSYLKINETDVLEFIKISNNEHIQLIQCKGPNNLPEPHLSVNNRKIPFHARIRYATELLQKLYDEYGQRALLAEQNQGIDHKALMHAVRVAKEAQELLLTSNITFPRPEKDLLLQIRKGELPYKQIAEIIEQGLLDVECAKNKSQLPEKPDYSFAEELIHTAHCKILGDYLDEINYVR